MTNEQRKPIKETSLINNRNARSVVNFLKHSKIPFVLTCSNYTTKIESEIMVKKFVHSLQSNRVFAAFSKIKSDIKKRPVPDINKSQLNYFQHDFNKTLSMDCIYNIDLKSAYATVLLKDGYITEATYKYLHTVPKKDRLASVGMLASKKMIFHYDGQGEVVDVYEKISENENFFYYAVKRTYEIMSQLRAIIGRGYLFTWVDGIYFTGDQQTVFDCAEYLDEIGFSFSAEELNKFNIVYDDKGVKLTFLKDGEYKTFGLPP